MQLDFRRSGSSRDTVLQNQVERAAREIVKNGFTHYPQKREEWRFFPGHPDLPTRIVVVDGDGALTFGVLAWLATQQIPLVQINWRGEAIVVGGAAYVADFELVQAQ